MPSRFRFSFSDMVKQQRRFEKTLTQAVAMTRKAIAATSVVKPATRTAKSIDRLEEVASFGSNPGRLRMLTYVPPGLPRNAALVVVLHGCRQTAEDYDQGSGWSTLARERGFALVYAEQTRSNNPNLCFNWFRPSNVTRDRGESLSIRQMVASMVSAHGIDSGRVFITGLSAGGAMTAAMLAAYPDVFRAGGIIAGLPFGAARDVQQAFSAMNNAPARTQQEWGDLVRTASPVGQVPPSVSPPSTVSIWPTVSIWHGTADQTVSVSNAQALVRQWTDLHGLAEDAFTQSEVDGHQRRVWKDASGAAVVEYYSIQGMGHGTPLKPRPASRPRAGTPGPYMLDAGISSSMHLATAWGLKKPTP